ncbi:hypothetical protein P7E02_14310 [Enterococcus hulanensis]|uniref:hypothetical protein n=1 Tax=Enterococcus hulanensis TaxID=2559929 RepID=UPI0028915439|nr:hypothetical protein [Enterococcus hulanensis]MDT2661049.1 hypothetical protein [Enterococcus hulanensis]
MSNEKKIIYRREPIKKYKMHKVKKHWVVKGGVAGAMIVGSVGAPLVPHLVYAAETEEIESGEEKGESLAETKDSTATTVESTIKAQTTATTETVAEETTETTEEEKTEDELKPSETTERAQSRAGYKYTAGVDDVISIENIQRITQDDNSAPAVYSTYFFDNGIKFLLELDPKKGELKTGDKIFIPLAIKGSPNAFLGKQTTLNGIGEITYVTDGNVSNYGTHGFELTLSEDLSESRRVNINFSGAGVENQPTFPLVYDELSKALVAEDVNLYFNGESIETISSTFKRNSAEGIAGSYSIARTLSANTLSALNYYQNSFTTQKVISGAEDPHESIENFIQISRVSLDSDEGLLTYTGKDKETIYDIAKLFIPTPDGNGVFDYEFYIEGENSYRFVDVPGDASNETISNILTAHGPSTYTTIKNSDGTYTNARNVCKGNSGLKLTESTQYKQSGATTPVEFFEMTFGIEYENSDVI